MKIKFDQDLISESPLKEAEKLETSVYKEFEGLIKNKASMLLWFIENCESPIERLLGLYLYHQEPNYTSYSDDGCYALYSQYKIKMSTGSEYRLDFFINAVYQGVNYALAIECDGHDFHERTKEQVERDNKRTRELQAAGITVVRFSGSEVLKAPAQCARDANMIIFGRTTYQEIEEVEEDVTNKAV